MPDAHARVVTKDSLPLILPIGARLTD